MSNDTCAAGSNLSKPAPERQMQILLNSINTTINRYRDAIDRYSTMNTGLTGVSDGPECEKGSSPNAPGIVHELFFRAECLNGLCDDLERENNRLNTLINDG